MLRLPPRARAVATRTTQCRKVICPAVLVRYPIGTLCVYVSSLYVVSILILSVTKQRERGAGAGCISADRVASRLGSYLQGHGPGGPLPIGPDYCLAMHSRKQNGKQAPEPETAQNLPCWDGTQITAPNWLRDLESNEHLFDADVAFYLQTGCVVTNAGKTAVISPEQSALLQQDIIRQSSMFGCLLYYLNSSPVPRFTSRRHICLGGRRAIVTSVILCLCPPTVTPVSHPLFQMSNQLIYHSRPCQLAACLPSLTVLIEPMRQLSQRQAPTQPNFHVVC